MPTSQKRKRTRGRRLSPHSNFGIDLKNRRFLEHSRRSSAPCRRRGPSGLDRNREARPPPVVGGNPLEEPKAARGDQMGLQRERRLRPGRSTAVSRGKIGPVGPADHRLGARDPATAGRLGSVNALASASVSMKAIERRELSDGRTSSAASQKGSLYAAEVPRPRTTKVCERSTKTGRRLRNLQRTSAARTLNSWCPRESSWRSDETPPKPPN